jgi:predicted flap endonuclease-1-like 5' DNA nuclease
MADRPSTWDYTTWPSRTWAAAGVAALVALILFLLFGAGFLFALVVAVLVFLAVVWWLQRDVVHEVKSLRPLDEVRRAPPPEPVVPVPAEEPVTVQAASAVPPPGGDPLAVVGSAPLGAGRPAGLSAPRDGGPDDLKLIKGIGPKIEALLNRHGYYHFDQLAGWSEAELAWVDANVEGFNGRASREDWVGQARLLAAGGSTEHSRRVEKDEA